MKLSATTTTAAAVAAVAFLGTAAADSHLNITPRFAGGSNADASEFPFMTSIFINTTDANGDPAQKLCGGAIIGNKHIITNAQCFYNFYTKKLDPLENIKVSCGGNNLVSPTSFKVKSARTAPGDLVKTVLANDMAVLEIDGSFTWNTNIVPVQFTTASLTDAQSVVAVSWGATTANSKVPVSQTLQKATVQIASDDTCKTKSGNVASYKDRNFMTVCTSAINGAGACDNDIGGALLLKEAKSYTLVGLYSFSFSAGGKICSVGQQFDYWSRPAYYKDFISGFTGIKTLMAPVGGADPLKNEPADSGSGMSVGAIVGIAVGSAAALFLIAGFAWWKTRSSRRKAADAQKRADDAEFVAAQAVHLAHENAQVAAAAAAAANAATSGYPVIYVDPSQPEYKTLGGYPETSFVDVSGVTSTSPNVYYPNAGYVSPGYAQLPITSAPPYPGYTPEGAASGYFATTEQVHPGILQTAQFYGTAGAPEQPGIAVATGVAGAPNLLPPQLTTDLAHEQDSLLPTPSTPVPPNASTHPATSPQ
ncbi:trypsin-like serine protease [Ramicandelaber brevisporus]|nr:trypsin-like serine protease [Ramicandelaber brevisporus]